MNVNIRQIDIDVSGGVCYIMYAIKYFILKTLHFSFTIDIILFTIDKILTIIKQLIK